MPVYETLFDFQLFPSAVAAVSSPLINIHNNIRHRVYRRARTPATAWKITEVPERLSPSSPKRGAGVARTDDLCRPHPSGKGGGTRGAHHRHQRGRGTITRWQGRLLSLLGRRRTTTVNPSSSLSSATWGGRGRPGALCHHWVEKGKRPDARRYGEDRGDRRGKGARLAGANDRQSTDRGGERDPRRRRMRGGAAITVWSAATRSTRANG